MGIDSRGYFTKKPSSFIFTPFLSLPAADVFTQEPPVFFREETKESVNHDGVWVHARMNTRKFFGIIELLINCFFMKELAKIQILCKN